MLMKIQILCFLLAIILKSNTHTYKCVFDQLNQDLTKIAAQNQPQISLVAPGIYKNSRLLQGSRAPIRIHLDTSVFSDPIATGVNGAETPTQAQLDIILTSLSIAKQFFQLRLQVGQLLQITIPNYCVNFQPSNEGANITNIDLYIFAKYLADGGIGYGATGKSCDYLTGILPDSTRQTGRPTVGLIIFNSHTLFSGVTSISNTLFQSITSTTLHQTMHIIGFDSTLYNTFLDPNTNNIYSPSIFIVNSSNVHSNRPNTNILSTPFVQAWVRNHYNCSTAQGMLLQNEDGVGISGGSHWQRAAIYDEIMTATSLGATKGFSGLTFALLKDTGWYTVDDSFAQTTNFGYKKGCQFLFDACHGSTQFSQFCGSSSNLNTAYCQSTFYGKASCNNAPQLMSDSCSIYVPFFSCIDDTSIDSGFQSKTKQIFDTNSFCFSSNIKTSSLGGSDAFLLSRCYQYVCQTDRIVINIGNYTITCLQSQTGISKTLSSLLGSLTCPKFSEFCTVSRKTCTNMCSKSGYCMNGICNCLANRFNADCSISSCSAGQYYNMNAQTCVTSINCPVGTYSNKYSHACQLCKSPCSSCTASSTNCLGCVSPLLLYNGACYSACPSSTYVSSFQCYSCDQSVNCEKCITSATFCISCLNGLFLTESTGSCAVNCPLPSHQYLDHFNFKCVATCPTYLIFNSPNCELCPTSQFNLNGVCQANCNNIQYFENSTVRACIPCHSSCYRCNGQYAQNCTACTNSTYLLLKMCWSICPKGFYANPSTDKCQVCPVQLSCSTCKYNTTDGSAYCTSCNYGTYLSSSTNLCGLSCNSTQFKGTWNSTCVSCHIQCATCRGQLSSSCLSCASSSVYLSNVTGGYCLSVCPSIGYISDNVTCRNCDSSCLSCSGVNSGQCITCQPGYYFYDNFCRYICPAGRYPNTSTLLCQQCDTTCSYCFGFGPNSCVHCSQGLYLYNFTCTITCPNDLQPNQWNVCFEHYILVNIVFSALIVFLTF